MSGHKRGRRKLERSRGALLSEALATCPRARSVEAAERRYTAGYLRRPEAADEVAATEALAAYAMASWKRWR